MLTHTGAKKVYLAAFWDLLGAAPSIGGEAENLDISGLWRGRVRVPELDLVSPGNTLLLTKGPL